MTSTTTLATLQPKIIREAQFIASQSSIMRGLVRNFTVPYGTGKTVNVPFYPVVTGEKVDELEAFTDQDISTSEKVLTVGTAGFSTMISDESVDTSADNVIASVGRIAGEAVARIIDLDLTGLLAGFSTVVGGSNVQMTPAHIFQAVAILRSKGFSGTDLVCVLNPLVAYDLKAGLTANFANPYAGPLQNQAMQTGYITTIGGVAVYESANVAETTGDSIGGLFLRDALGFALLKDVHIEFQRYAAKRATQMVVSAVYGTGELVDGYGVAMSFDSSLAVNAA